MNYTETQQKLILREMERDILAIVAIDLRGDEYEVIYSDGAYKNYKNRYRRKDFFASWEKYGIPQVYEPDRARLLAEISLENLTEKLSSGGDFYTIARLYVKGRPAFCRIKASKDVLDVGNMVISIRNVDAELRHDMERTAQMEELHRRETVYREAILANSAGFMEINLSRDEITTRIFDEEWFSRALSYPGSSFDGLSGFMAEGLILSDRREFLDFSSCQSLIECFEAQRRVVSIEFKMGTPPGGARVCIMTYYISKDKVTGDIVAVCVLYDLTRHKKRERDIKALRETLKQMRIKNFISQMHPHFLYNALRRLRLALEKAGIPELLISAARGQMVDTSLFDCDYYDWLDGRHEGSEGFRGEFLTEYSWAEYLYGTLSTDGHDE